MHACPQREAGEASWQEQNENSPLVLNRKIRDNPREKRKREGRGGKSQGEGMELR